MASQSFLTELRRRNVIRMAGLYLLGAWLLVQVASTLFPAFAVPDWALRAVVIVLVLGFVPALVFSWVFELTPEGLKRDAEVPPGQSIAPQTARRMERIIVALLVLALGYFALDKFVLAPRRATAVAAESRSQVAGVPAPAADNSIAVLPFVDMSQGKDQEYFSDGLSEELLNQLAQIPQLRVIARTSSFSFKGKEVGVADIARILKVAHVLEGSVRKSGNTLRITAQLIRTSDSSHLWSNTYDRELTDVFKVQDEISREVVAALKLKLLAGQVPDNTQRTRNSAAYEQYLIGVDVVRVGGRGPVEAALAAFQRAIALDPGYANAYAQLGFVQASSADFAASPAAREATIARALASAEKAIALAPDLPIAYLSRGNTRYRMRWDWQGARADFDRALTIEPNNAQAMVNYAPVLFTLGRREQGLEVLRRAVVADPLSENVWAALGRCLEAAGQIAEAKQAYARALEINPQQNWANFLLGNRLLTEGDVAGAIAHYQRAPEQFQATGMAMAEFTRGDEAASQQALTKLEHDFAIGFAYQIAQVHAWRGEKDAAFAWLDRCLLIHDAGLVRLPFDPAMDRLRSDPRFAALVAKMGIPK
ncbi:MAG: tetratricopeptide repeat protein [Arenimonas sp.]